MKCGMGKLFPSSSFIELFTRKCFEKDTGGLLPVSFLLSAYEFQAKWIYILIASGNFSVRQNDKDGIA